MITCTLCRQEKQASEVIFTTDGAARCRDMPLCAQAKLFGGLPKQAATYVEKATGDQRAWTGRFPSVPPRRETPSAPQRTSVFDATEDRRPQEFTVPLVKRTSVFNSDAEDL